MVRLVLLLVLATPAGGLAQSPVAWTLGGAGTVNLLVGSSELIDGGFGADLSLARPLLPHLKARASVRTAWIGGHETAANTLTMMTVGPEVVAGIPQISVYAHGFLGAAINFQRRSNSPFREATSWARTFGAGAGLRSRALPRLELDAGAEVIKVGEVVFAWTGDTGSLPEEPVVLRLRLGAHFAL